MGTDGGRHLDEAYAKGMVPKGKIYQVVSDEEIIKTISEIQRNWSGYNKPEHPEEKISVWSRGLLNSLRNRFNVRITRKEPSSTDN